MARPLREGSLAEPPAPLPGPGPRLSCACPGAPPPPFVLYRCGTRGPPAAATAHGEFQPTEDGEHEGAPQSGGSRGGAVPNGHLPGEAPSPEQELGARLRRLGDAFQQTYEQQRGGGDFWGHLYRLVSQLLGAIYNLQAAALPAREAN